MNDMLLPGYLATLLTNTEARNLAEAHEGVNHMGSNSNQVLASVAGLVSMSSHGTLFLKSGTGAVVLLGDHRMVTFTRV